MKYILLRAEKFMSSQYRLRPAKGTTRIVRPDVGDFGTPHGSDAHGAEPAPVTSYEWAYVTPRYPNGIGETELRSASDEIQKKCAIFWFISNIKKHKDDGFIFGENTFGEETFGNSPVHAGTFLIQEFNGILNIENINEIGEAFGPNWMWVGQNSSGSNETLSMRADISEIVQILDELSRLIDEIKNKNDLLGHNNPPDQMDTDILETTSSAINDVKIMVLEEKIFSDTFLASRLKAISAGCVEIGRWALSQAKVFVDEARPPLAGSVPDLIVLGISAAVAGDNFHMIAAAYFVARRTRKS